MMASFDRVLEIFYDLCSIPHPSGHTEGIREYLHAFAKKNDLYCHEDKGHNILIKKGGTLKSKPVILQAHIDMVGVSDDPSIDMAKHKIETYIDGDYLKAKGTTLGGDDGIGVAYILALLEDKDLISPPIEGLFTVDEETGMDGAVNLEMDYLEGKRLINIDSEDEGELLSSSAGGAHLTIYPEVTREKMSGTLCKIEVSGLYGGHSGQEIKRRGLNAIKVLFDNLHCLEEMNLVGLVSIKGGEALNIIPKCAVMEVVTPDAKKLIDEIKKAERELKNTYASTDPNLKLECSVVKENGEFDSVEARSLKTALASVHKIPCGVIKTSPQDDTFVVLSANYGKVSLSSLDTTLTLQVSFRGNDDDEKAELLENVETALKKFKTLKYVIDAIYPGWKYQKSELREIMKGVYKDMYGKEMKEMAIHAGLECGYFIKKRPSIDATSIGPNVYDVHTTSERLSLSSSKRVFEYIIKVLEKL